MYFKSTCGGLGLITCSPVVIMNVKFLCSEWFVSNVVSSLTFTGKIIIWSILEPYYWFFYTYCYLRALVLILWAFITCKFFQKLKINIEIPFALEIYWARVTSVWNIIFFLWKVLKSVWVALFYNIDGDWSYSNLLINLN